MNEWERKSVSVVQEQSHNAHRARDAIFRRIHHEIPNTVVSIRIATDFFFVFYFVFLFGFLSLSIFALAIQLSLVVRLMAFYLTTIWRCY